MNINKKKGITLIALVITIILLLILAGVSISMLSGDNSILTKATEAKEKTEKATEDEQIKLAVNGSFDEATRLKVDNVKQSVRNQVENVEKIEGESFPLKVTTKEGNVYYIEENGQITKPIVIEPKISNNMTPIYWKDNNTEVETTSSDSNWFNYDNALWANAKTTDGSYWVWIPRFEYKITYTDESNYANGGNIDVKLIDVSQTTPDKGYIIHPAFTNESSTNYANGGWNKDISGFWAAKFEMSMEENGVHVETSSSDIGNQAISSSIKMVSKPNVTSWCHILPGNAYINSYNYDRERESHLMKNSEWGAIAYLSYSKYGLNGTEIYINTSNVTGQSTGKTNAAPSDTNYPYNTTQGVGASTTGNITGIYDMSGGLWDFTASYNSKDTSGYLEKNGLGYFAKDAQSTQYMTVYNNENGNQHSTSTVGKIGDGIKEIRNNPSNKASWFNDSVHVPCNKDCFSMRGGHNGSKTEAGIFCAGYNKGGESVNKSFRTVLIEE